MWTSSWPFTRGCRSFESSTSSTLSRFSTWSWVLEEMILGPDNESSISPETPTPWNGLFENGTVLKKVYMNEMRCQQYSLSEVSDPERDFPSPWRRKFTWFGWRDREQDHSCNNDRQPEGEPRSLVATARRDWRKSIPWRAGYWPITFQWHGKDDETFRMHPGTDGSMRILADACGRFGFSCKLHKTERRICGARRKRHLIGVRSSRYSGSSLQFCGQVSQRDN